VGAVAKGAVDVGAVVAVVVVAVETLVVGSLGYIVDVAAAAAGVGGGTTVAGKDAVEVSRRASGGSMTHSSPELLLLFQSSIAFPLTQVISSFVQATTPG